MALRFLADHCVPNSVIQTLRDANQEVLRVKDVLPVESPDSAVIAKAQEVGAILTIVEWRFCRHRYLPAGNVQRNSGVASAQSPRGASSFDGQTQRNLKAQPAVEHYRGKLFVVEVDRIRIRE